MLVCVCGWGGGLSQSYYSFFPVLGQMQKCKTLWWYHKQFNRHFFSSSLDPSASVWETFKKYWQAKPTPTCALGRGGFRRQRTRLGSVCESPLISKVGGAYFPRWRPVIGPVHRGLLVTPLPRLLKGFYACPVMLNMFVCCSLLLVVCLHETPRCFPFKLVLCVFCSRMVFCVNRKAKKFCQTADRSFQPNQAELNKCHQFLWCI